MAPYLEILAGLLLAAAGGEAFLRGVLGLSEWLRIPKAVAASTLAAFATSSPEISVAINAATAGTPEIALGDALGSNIVNTSLVLGIILLFGPLAFRLRANRRDYSIAFAAPLLLAFALRDGLLAHYGAILLLSLFAAWMAMTIQFALKGRKPKAEVFPTRRKADALGLAAAGIILLVYSGKLIVSGGTELGTRLGMDLFLIGATVVAFGTSAPELATAVISKLRGHDEVGVGTILGSNIFNCLFIVGLAALIEPIREPVANVLPTVGFGLLALLLLIPFADTKLPRSRGFALLALYAMSILAAWLGGPKPH